MRQQFYILVPVEVQEDFADKQAFQVLLSNSEVIEEFILQWKVKYFWKYFTEKGESKVNAA